MITGTQQRLAVPDCRPAPGDEAAREACQTLTRVVRDDLEFPKLFRFVDEDLYALLSQPDPVAPDFEDWRAIFANFLITTTARVPF